MMYQEQQEQQHQQPACSGRTELFFSEKTQDMRAAQVICATCTLRVQCLEQARLHKAFAGVWGGVIFVNGEEILLKRGRGRPRKSEELDNARVLKALAVNAPVEEVIQEPENEEIDDSQHVLQRHIA